VAVASIKPTSAGGVGAGKTEVLSTAAMVAALLMGITHLAAIRPGFRAQTPPVGAAVVVVVVAMPLVVTVHLDSS